MLEDVHVPENCENDEISINYIFTGEKLDRNKTIINEIFAYNVALNIMHESKDLEPRSVEECRQRNDWPKWEEAMKDKLDSLAKHEVFGPVVRTPEDVKPVGYKWVFVRKRNEKNEVVSTKLGLWHKVFHKGRV